MTDALPRTATGADDRLKNYVLAQTGGNERLSEPTCLVVLPALGGREDLADVLGDDAISQKVLDSITTLDDAPEPVGAYLKSITLQGFRSVGPKVKLPIQPGTGAGAGPRGGVGVGRRAAVRFVDRGCGLGAGPRLDDGRGGRPVCDRSSFHRCRPR